MPFLSVDTRTHTQSLTGNINGWETFPCLFLLTDTVFEEQMQIFVEINGTKNVHIVLFRL